MTRAAHDDDDERATPRWVKVFGAVAAVLALGFVALHLAGGGFRGHGSATHEGAAP